MSAIPRFDTPDRLAAGFTLLEVLITIVVISIGLLGLLELQSVSLINTQTSAARSRATIAADNMADRIRANPIGASEGDYVKAKESESQPAEMPNDCVNGQICSPEQMAVFDSKEWNQTLHQTLPAGRGSIQCSKTTSTECMQYTITITWRERDHGGGNDNDHTRCGTSDSVIERCFQTVVEP